VVGILHRRDGVAAGKLKVALPADRAVDAEVDLLPVLSEGTDHRAAVFDAQ
jgi:hypothetical protein